MTSHGTLARRGAVVGKRRPTVILEPESVLFLLLCGQGKGNYGWKVDGMLN